MVRLFVALTGPGAGRYLREAARYGHEILGKVSTEAELLDALRQDLPDRRNLPDAVLASAALVTEGLLDRCDRLGVRLVAIFGDDAERRAVAALGLHETVPAGTPWAELDDLVAGRRAAPSSFATEIERSGTVIAVWGPAGAPGRTTLAIGIAAELAAAGHTVALADVDTHGAAVAPTLGLLDESPGFAAACRLAGADGLSRAEFERIGQRYGSGPAGFWVLTGIGRSSRWPELSAERVRRTIAECRTWVDFTVLDTGFSLEDDIAVSSDLHAPHRNGASVAALRSADRIIAVGSADPVGLARFLRSYNDLRELAPDSSPTVVMNKVRASALGLNPAGQLIRTLERFGGIVDAVLVPDDRAGFDTALLAGKTLREVSPRSPARLAVSEFVVDRVLPKKQPAEARRPGRRRFGRSFAVAD